VTLDVAACNRELRNRNSRSAWAWTSSTIWRSRQSVRQFNPFLDPGWWQSLVWNVAVDCL